MIRSGKARRRLTSWFSEELVTKNRGSNGFYFNTLLYFGMIREPLWRRVHRRFWSNHAFRYMYALALFTGWIAGLTARADLPNILLAAEVFGLGMWMIYESFFATATVPAAVIGSVLMIIGAISAFTVFTLFTLNTYVILAIIGLIAYGAFGVILNLDALHEVVATKLMGRRA